MCIVAVQPVATHVAPHSVNPPGVCTQLIHELAGLCLQGGAKGGSNSASAAVLRDAVAGRATSTASSRRPRQRGAGAAEDATASPSKRLAKTMVWRHCTCVCVCGGDEEAAPF